MYDQLDEFENGGDSPYDSRATNAAPNPFAPISAAQRLNAIPSKTGKYMAPMRSLRPGDAYSFQPYQEAQNTFVDPQPPLYWEQTAPYAQQEEPFLASPTNDYFTGSFMPAMPQQMPQYQQSEPLFEQPQVYQSTQLPPYLQQKQPQLAEVEEPAVPSQMRWDGNDFVALQEEFLPPISQESMQSEEARIVSTFDTAIDEEQAAEVQQEQSAGKRRSRVARNAQTYQQEEETEHQALYYPELPEDPSFDMQHMANDLIPPMMPTSEDEWAMDVYVGEEQDDYAQHPENSPATDEQHYARHEDVKPQRAYFASNEFRSDAPAKAKVRSGSYHQAGEQFAGLLDAFEPAQADTPPLFQADVQKVQSKMQIQAAKPVLETSPVTQPKPQLNIGRVIALVLGVALFLFCVIGGVKFAVNVMNNKEEVKQFKQNNLVGNNADVVVLPPAGQTFAPTATPAPQAQPALQNAMVADSEPTEAAEDDDVRSKSKNYANNPLGNIIDSMKALNTQYPSAVGQLTIEGVLDEVVTQKNNIYYLTHDYTDATSDSGAVYMDESCSIKMPPENLLLRGRSDFDGKVFAALSNFDRQEYVTGKTRATLRTLYEDVQYVLFAVIVANNDASNENYFNYASQPTFSSDAEMMRYVQKARSRSLFQFNVDVAATDRLLTLATISSNADESMVLMYRMLRANESTI